MNQKTTIIGLDGCELDIILELSEKGKLPFFKKIIDSGAFGKLRSTIPPTTFPAWPSMFTGKNPGKLGVFDFFQLIKSDGGYSQKLVNSRTWQGSLLWDLVNKHGKTSGIINLPFFMPTNVDGIWLDLHMANSYPNDLFEKISSELDCVDLFDNKIRATKVGELKRLKENTDVELDIGNHLQHTYPDLDVFIQVFNILDGTAHSSQSENVLKDRYMYIDEQLKRYLGENDSNVIIVSDHGMKKVSYRYYINKWLLNNEYLRLKEPSQSRINSLSRSISYKITNLFPSLEFHLDDLANILGRKISPMKNLRNKEADIKTASYATSLVDWKNTEIYAHASNASNYMGLWFTEFSDKLKEELMNKLKETTYGRNKKPIIKNIFEKDSIYKGDKKENLPQLVLELQGDILAHTTMAPITYRSTKTFAHDLYGTLIAWGPDIKEGYRIQGAEIIDITPTILHMFEVPIPSDVDGKVLDDIFNG
jgi:predicted AlkP superfamily phosphohydrolase/phosphomutase